MDRSELFDRRKNKVLELMNDPLYKPMKEKELAVLMDVSKEDRHDLRMMLNELMDEGRIEVNARGKYKTAAPKTFTGKYVSNAKGFGFVEVEDRDEDLFIPEGESNGAYDSDTVEAELIPRWREISLGFTSSPSRRRARRSCSIRSRSPTATPSWPPSSSVSTAGRTASWAPPCVI